MDRITWREDLWQRVSAHAGLKAAGITAFMAIFFAGYFLVLHHPFFPVTVMPQLPADRLVAFQPGALILYVSLWIFVILPPALMRGRRELWLFSGAAALLAVTGLAIFALWPTSVPPSQATANHWGFAYLKRFDASGNACPSLHVAFAVFTAIWLGWLLPGMGDRGAGRTLAWAWCLGILYSTLATKQHVMLDVVAGAALGAAVALAFRRPRALSAQARPSSLPGNGCLPQHRGEKHVQSAPVPRAPR